MAEMTHTFDGYFFLHGHELVADTAALVNSPTERVCYACWQIVHTKQNSINKMTHLR